jgi:hypothetical protein
MHPLVAEYGLDRFCERLHEDGRFAIADWTQIRRLADGGVELLAHGHLHLAQGEALDAEQRRVELEKPRAMLRERLGVSPSGFVFPFGTLGSTSPEELARAGYTFGLTSRPGRVEAGSDPLMLPRRNAQTDLLHLRRRLADL